MILYPSDVKTFSIDGRDFQSGAEWMAPVPNIEYKIEINFNIDEPDTDTDLLYVGDR